MKWWARSPLHTKIFLAFSAVVLAVLFASLGFAQWFVSRDAVRTLNRELATTGQVFDGLMAERAARLESNSILLASDFALKRVLATHFDPDMYEPGTLTSVAMSYRGRIGVDLLWITDEAGELLALSPEEPGVGRSIADLSPLKEALDTDEASTAIGEIDGRLMQLVAVPVFGPDVIAYLLLGQAVDDALAQRLQHDTGSHISFLTDERVYATSWPKGVQYDFVPAEATTSVLHGSRAPQKISLIRVGDDRYLSLALPIDARLSRPLYSLVQGNYDRALEPLRALQRRIAATGTAALLAALLIGIGLARGITSPVQRLVAGMREVLRGNLRFRSSVEREDEIGFLATSFNEMVGGLEDRERIKDTFGRFVSYEVAEAVLSGRVPLEGERREVSILFQDIRGFTTLSERLDPAALLKLLNQFFTEVVAAVEGEGGVVKQFVGDGVMALFGAPQTHSDHAERAVRAALGIVSRLARLNEQWRAQGAPPLEIGVGIHTGSVVAGLIGPDQRVEYGVVGDPVNLANRVETLTKDLQATVLVSRDIADRLGDRFELGRSATLPVKGRKQPVEVVEVLGQQVPPPAAAKDRRGVGV
jgi:adenylate cyclase